MSRVISPQEIAKIWSTNTYRKERGDVVHASEGRVPQSKIPIHPNFPARAKAGKFVGMWGMRFAYLTTNAADNGFSNDAASLKSQSN